MDGGSCMWGGSVCLGLVCLVLGVGSGSRNVLQRLRLLLLDFSLWASTAPR